MASNKVLYAVRLPVDLKRLIDQAARSGGVTTSQLVIAACWKYLDRSPKPLEAKPAAIPVVNGNAAMQAFLSNLPPSTPVALLPYQDALLAVQICPKVGYNEIDGESYRCRLERGHKGNCAPGERV
jgi:hypothetical protein